jgi:hypothetical protein
MPDPVKRKPFALYMAVFAVYIFCALGIVRVIHFAASLPVVYESYTTGHCVRVDDPTGVYNCENMPHKFHHVWTQ